MYIVATTQYCTTLEGEISRNQKNESLHENVSRFYTILYLSLDGIQSI